MAEEGGLPTWGSANVNTAIVVSLGAGLATGIGGAVAFVPQIFASVKQGVILSVALAISAGVMLYVSFIEIFVKAQAEIEKSLGPSGAAATTTACFFAGMLFCVVLELLVHKCMGHGRAVPPSGAATSATDGGSPGEVSVELGNVTAGAQDAKALTDGYAAVATSEVEQKAQLKKMGALTAVAIALHNFPEGLATFMATVDDPSMGVALGERAIRRNSVRNIRRNFSSSPPPASGIAIAIHNIPEGVCVAMPIYYSTGSKWKGFLWSLFSGITEPIGGIIGFAVLQSVFTELVFGVVFAMVGGMMVFIVLHELLPTAHRYMPDRPGYVTFFLVVGMVVMAISLVLFAI